MPRKKRWIPSSANLNKGLNMKWPQGFLIVIVLLIFGVSCSKRNVDAPVVSTKVRFSEYASREGDGGQIQFQDECYSVTIDRLEPTQSRPRPLVRVSYAVKLADDKIVTLVIDENGNIEK